MLFDLEAQPLRNRVLPGFDLRVDELFDRAAVHTDDMIVVRAVIDLEHRHAVFEMMAASPDPRPRIA
jgi:hypothetical protein